jgi:hypothetical protein
MKLFCKHSYSHLRNIHGDEINYRGGKRSIFICKKCGKIKYGDLLYYLDDEERREYESRISVDTKNKVIQRRLLELA